MKKKVVIALLTLIAVLCAGCITAYAYDYYEDEYDYGPYKISASNVKLSKYTYTYNGEAKEPSVTVKYDGEYLDPDYDYYYYYSKNKNAGTATVVVKGCGNYYGTVKKKFKIKPKKVKKARFLNKQHYSGKAKKPAVYVKMKKSYYDDYDGCYYTYTDTVKVPKKYYKLKISGKHKNVGTYKATIKFKGNYRGTVKTKLKIYPQKVRKLRAKAVSSSKVKFTWAKAPKVDGYEIYKYSTKKKKWCLYKRQKGTSITIAKNSSYDDDGVGIDVRTYKYVKKKKYCSDFKYKYGRTKLTAPKIKISRTDFGEFHVKFKNYGYYQVQISDNSSFSSYGYCQSWKYYTTDVRYYNFTSGKKYYVRARKYYYADNGNLKVGPWCKYKTVTPW